MNDVIARVQDKIKYEGFMAPLSKVEAFVETELESGCTVYWPVVVTGSDTNVRDMIWEVLNDE